MDGATGSEQRTGDIGSNGDADVAHSRVQVRQVDLGNTAEIAAGTTEFSAVIVEESGAESRHQTGACIDGGAAAKAENDAVGAAVEGVTDQLAGPETRSLGGVQIIPEKRQTGRRGHLDDRQMPVGNPRIRCDNDPVERVSHAHVDQLPAEDAEQRVYCSLSAVGHGNEDGFNRFVDLAHSCIDRRGNLQTGHRALERIRCHDDAHDPILTLPAARISPVSG